MDAGLAAAIGIVRTVMAMARDVIARRAARTGIATMRGMRSVAAKAAIAEIATAIAAAGAKDARAAMAVTPKDVMKVAVANSVRATVSSVQSAVEIAIATVHAGAVDTSAIAIANVRLNNRSRRTQLQLQSLWLPAETLVRAP